MADRLSRRVFAKRFAGAALGALAVPAVPACAQEGVHSVQPSPEEAVLDAIQAQRTAPLTSLQLESALANLRDQRLSVERLRKMRVADCAEPDLVFAPMRPQTRRKGK